MPLYAAVDGYLDDLTNKLIAIATNREKKNGSICDMAFLEQPSFSWIIIKYKGNNIKPNSYEYMMRLKKMILSNKYGYFLRSRNLYKKIRELNRKIRKNCNNPEKDRIGS